MQANAMVQTPAPTISLEDFLARPKTKPASEYMLGEVTQKPMPQGKHSLIQAELTRALNQSLKRSQMALALPELRCTFAGSSIVPDIAVFLWHRLPRDPEGAIANTFNAAPDWTIEILSPDQSPSRVIRNILYCLQQGCTMGWLIDPDSGSVIVYPAGEQALYFDQADEQIRVPDFVQPWQLSVGELWSWLQI
jgi:Uma2 family endonuclease